MASNARNKPPGTTSRRGSKAAPRGPGRPPASAGDQLSRAAIIAHTLELAKTTPLHELSVVAVARDLGVAPGLVHYYLGSRDKLISGVMNGFYRLIATDWPPPTEDWRADLDSAGRRLHRFHVEYVGIAAYVTAHNRFRMAQLVEPGEVDYGLLLFDRFVGVVRRLGFDARRTATYAQLLVDFLVTSATSTLRRRWPDEHAAFMERVFSRLDPAVYPHASFVRRDFISTSAQSAFEAGWSLVLAGIESERALALTPTDRGTGRR